MGTCIFGGRFQSSVCCNSSNCFFILCSFAENFIALFGILGTLMVACELIDLRGKMRNLHASGKTRVHVDGGGVVQNHLRA